MNSSLRGSGSKLAVRAHKKIRWSENHLLFLGLVLTLVVLVTQSGDEPFVPFVFGLSLFLFLCQKIRLGNSLRFNNLTLPSFFMFMYLLLIPFGAIATFRQMYHPIRHTYLMAMQSIFVTFPIGVALANRLVKNPSGIIQSYLSSQIEVTPSDLKFRPVFYILLFSAFPILLLYFLYSNYVQLIEVIKQYPTAINVETLKFAGSNDLPRPVQLAFELLRRFILPLCVLYAYLMSCGRRPGWKYVFSVLFASALFVSALTLDRAPPLAFVVMFILAYLLRTRKPLWASIVKIRLITIFIVAVTVGGIISVLQYQSDFNLQEVVARTRYVLSYRILQDAPYMASIAFETFDGSTSFLYGRSMRILSTLPGFHYAESDASISSPAAPVGFVADLWRNFGWFGVIVGTILIGFAYQMVQLKLFVKKTILTVSLNVILLVGCIWIIYGNVLGVTSTSVLFLGVLFGIFHRGRRGRRIKGERQLALYRQAHRSGSALANLRFSSKVLKP